MTYVVVSYSGGNAAVVVAHDELQQWYSTTQSVDLVYGPSGDGATVQSAQTRVHAEYRKLWKGLRIR